MSVKLYIPEKAEQPSNCQLFSFMGILAAIPILGGGYMMYVMILCTFFTHNK